MANVTGTQGAIDQRPMRADARRNYERILAVARDVFVERGSGATLEEVARRAQVGIGTLYRHFPRREDLLVAVMKGAMDDLHAHAIDLREADDPMAAFEEYLRYWLNRTAVFKGIAVEVMEEELRCGLPWASSIEAMHEDLRVLLRRAQEAGAIRPDVTDTDVWRLMKGVGQCLGDAQVHPDDTRRMFDVILRGLRA